MIWLYVLFITPLITATRQRDETSYPSNGLPGNTPIIILQAKSRAHSEFDSGEDRQTSSPPKMKVPGWERKRLVKLLSSLLPTKVENTPEPYYPIPAYNPSALRHHHGNKPKLILLVKADNSEFDSGLQQLRSNKTFPDAVKEFWTYWSTKLLGRRSHGSIIDDKPILRMPSMLDSDFISGFNQDDNPVLPSKEKNDLDSEHSLRSKKKRLKNKKKHGEQTQPKWVTDLKDYTKGLTTNYGLEETHQRLKPVIRSIEKKRHVKVKDVDVDEYGEIHVSYIERKKNKKKSARHGNINDET